jgi:hypothetical protein
MNKLEEKIKFENLIKSKQSVHTVCKGNYNNNNDCRLIHFYTDLKCGYKIDNNCTYKK